MSSELRESAGGKFTPGPWVAEPNSYADGPHVPGSYKIHRAGSRQWVATQVTERDSALIAAAPDMYAALEAAYELATCDRHDGDDVAARIRHVLSKAKGGAA